MKRKNFGKVPEWREKETFELRLKFKLQRVAGITGIRGKMSVSNFFCFPL